jgi:hypothetical protein
MGVSIHPPDHQAARTRERAGFQIGVLGCRCGRAAPCEVGSALVSLKNEDCRAMNTSAPRNAAVPTTKPALELN